jgi:hypothetical protein
MAMVDEPNPIEDGLTHIRISIRAKTKLGRLLHNRAHTPYKAITAYGQRQAFESLEGNWLCSRSGVYAEKLAKLYGPASERAGIWTERRARPGEVFRHEICIGLRSKIEQTPVLFNLLRDSELPFVRYDLTDGDYPTIIVHTEQSWFMRELEIIRTDIKKRPALAEPEPRVLKADQPVRASDRLGVHAATLYND